ncbi:hypothetical protein DFH09DRAFT_1160505 [Mycena vulgaris]|nr:hypothetical protein DFH09DRAFT_1160505 [Mycena vulgaris]
MTNMSTQSKIKPEVVVPVAAGIAGAGLGAAATALLAAPVLGLAGFSSIGPVAGTLAASIQASIGSVAAGSSFAVAQSIAMGGMAIGSSGSDPARRRRHRRCDLFWNSCPHEVLEEAQGKESSRGKGEERKA